MKKITDFINRVSNLPMLIISIVLFMSFILYFLPSHQAKSNKFMNNVGTPDLKFFPTPEYVYEAAEAYEAEGRKKYILSKFTIDLAWPFVFTLLYLVFINLSFGYVHGPKWSNLSILSLVTLVCDYVENFVAAVVMAAYPVKLDFITWLLTFTTCLKWLSMYFNSILFCYGLLSVPLCFILRRKKVLTRNLVDVTTVDKSTNIPKLKMSEKQTFAKEPLGPMLTRTSRAVGSMLQKMFLEAGHDLSADEWAILANLSMLCNGQSQQQLADRTLKDKAAITRLIDGLEKKELVRRIPDEKDRRQKKIFLTLQSSTLVKKLLPVAKRAQEKGQKGIDLEQLEIFNRVLKQIFENTSNSK